MNSVVYRDLCRYANGHTYHAAYLLASLFPRRVPPDLLPNHFGKCVRPRSTSVQAGIPRWVDDPKEQSRDLKGCSIKPGDCFELKGGDFFKVTQLVLGSPCRAQILRGWRFRRNRDTHGLPHRTNNDVYLVLYSNKSNGLQELKASEILGRTNMAFAVPAPSPHVKWTKSDEIHISGVKETPVCRWIHSFSTKPSYLDDNKLKKERNPPTDAFQPCAVHVESATFIPWGSEEASFAVEDLEKYHEHSREQRRTEDQAPDPRLSLTHNNDETSLRLAMERLSVNDHIRPRKIQNEPPGRSNTEVEPKSYTLGDCFCGCGGASEGARKAGLEVVWGLDHNKAACESYRLNFPGARCFEMEVQDFHSVPEDQVQIDILHISNPCQPFSNAKTMIGKDDKANVEASRMIGTVLDKAKPRVATLENVGGLVSRKNGYWGKIARRSLDEILQQFTSRRFAISWKTVKMEEHGLPQYRARFIIIAAA